MIPRPHNVRDKFSKDDDSELTEILGQPPSWLTRWGISMYFILFLSVIVACALIPYPNTVAARLRIVAINVPKPLIAKVDGRVTKVLINDRGTVRRNQVLMYMESTASHEEVSLLEKEISKMDDISPVQLYEKLSKIEIPQLSNLGDLQKSYQVFMHIYVHTKHYISKYYGGRKMAIQKDIDNLKMLNKNLKSQLTTQGENFLLSTEDLQMNQRLFDERVISASELRAMRSRFLSNRQSLTQTEGQLYNNIIIENQKRLELIELEKDLIEKLNEFKQTSNSLKSDIFVWKSNYIITAPFEGRVVLIPNVQNNSFVRRGQECLILIPDTKPNYYGEMYVRQPNFGTVHIPQRVILKFDSYPYYQYGIVEGRVHDIMELPRDSSFFVKVSLPSGLRTKQGFSIQPKNGLTANAEIVTEERSLLSQMLFSAYQVVQ